SHFAEDLIFSARLAMARIHMLICGKKIALHSDSTLEDSKTGRTLSVATTEPGVQFYAGNFLDGSNIGKGGVVYNKRSGFCLETQHFPDSINHGHFPKVTLKPGEVYRTTTVYTFGVE
ncbi:MAG: hypothetical protein AAGB46_19105, partial [Verrucomicrobiota bacterium]